VRLILGSLLAEVLHLFTSHLNRLIRNFAHEAQVDFKYRAVIYFRLDSQFAAHFLQQFSADREAQTPTMWVFLGLNIDLLEVNKQVIQFLLCHSHSKVLDADFQLHKTN